jgi:signal peptidase
MAARDAGVARERGRSKQAGSSGIRPTSVAALAGLAVLAVAVGVAVFGFGVSLVRLATGSMSPTFPADSILVVRSVPAADLAIGDVVTVSRDGLVPITHRVVSVTPVGVSGGAELVLRGDANTADDPEPYQVARVGLVLGGIPVGGGVLVAVQSPVGLGVATVVVCGLLLWAWWPRREPGAHLVESP